MAVLALPMHVVRSSSWVAPPQAGQSQVPPGSELFLIATSTWSQGSGYHSKTSGSRQAATHQHSQLLGFGNGRAVGLK